MRLLTYNLWHGLDGRGHMFFGELEPRGRRVARAQLQVQLFRQFKPDILFCQELNPLYPGVYFFGSQLGMDHIEQLDLSGIKFLGFGPPFNLQSGLGLFVTTHWGLSRIDGLQLSGDSPSSRGPFSAQLRESRYALLGEIFHPDWGRVLLIDLHLHHGVEYDEPWTFLLNQMVTQDRISEGQKRSLQSALQSGDRRRRGEMSRLLTVLNNIKDKYDLVVMAGDFNSGPESLVSKQVRNFGFQDAWRLSQSEAEGFTWDDRLNKENHEYNEQFRANFDFSTEDISNSVRDELIGIVREAERRPRRIDHLYFLTDHPYNLETNLFLGHDSAGILFASDHFGVSVTLERK